MPVSISSKTSVRCAAADFFFGARADSLARLDARLQRQHDARKFAARGDLLQRTHRLASIGRNAIDHLIDARRSPVLLVFVLFYRDPKTGAHGKVVDLRLDQLL